MSVFLTVCLALLHFVESLKVRILSVFFMPTSMLWLLNFYALLSNVTSMSCLISFYALLSNVTSISWLLKSYALGYLVGPTVTSMSWLLNFRLGPDEYIMRMIPMYDVITVGKNVSMQCIPPSETCDNVTFHRGRKSLSPPIAFRIYPDKIPPGRDKYVASRAWLGCLLIIRDAEVNDTGPYTCRFMNSFQITAELYVVGKLFVHLPLFFTCTLIKTFKRRNTQI